MRALALAVIAACAATPKLELVESWPSGTTLDTDLRDAAAVWPEMIAGAKRTIDLAEFYLSNEAGSRLERVVAALEAAIARGVRVRLLVEPSFVTIYPDTIERLRKAGAQVQHADFTPGILHAKYFIVDNRTAFLGSQNFDYRALEHIIELGVKLDEPALVNALAALFEADWSRAPMTTAQPPDIRLVASPRDRLPPGIEWDLPRLIAMLDTARSSIRVQLLTYRAGDWTELEGPLIRAAARGVRVELMLADWSLRPQTLPGLRTLATTSKVSIKLVTIPPAAQFIPYARVSHAKLLVVDGERGWIGTSNWEREYFYASRNVGVVFGDPVLATRLDRFFEHVWSSPYATAFDPSRTYTPPRIE